jgi:hypothetical protein
MSVVSVAQPRTHQGSLIEARGLAFRSCVVGLDPGSVG